MAKKRKCYVLEYASRWSEMETFAPMNYREAYREYESLLYSCGFDFTDYMEETIPKKIYDNITFLRRFISIYFYIIITRKASKCIRKIFEYSPVTF